MKLLLGVLSIAVSVGLAGCATVDDLFEKEKEVALSEVPASVIAAAIGAIKGFVPTEAEVEETDGQTVYEIEGTVDGKTCEIEVTVEGKVLEVEQKE